MPDGIDGTDDIKGSAKPLVFGPVYNITVKEVNTSKLIFQVHDDVAAIPAAYDMGVPLPQGTDYTDESDMETNAPSAGTYRVWSSATYGTFARLGSSPAGSLTFDVVEGATAADRTAAQIAKRMALRGISSGEISSADITALDAKNSAEVGIYIADGSTFTIREALDQVLGSIGAWYTFDIDAVLRMGRLELPTGEPDVTLTDGGNAISIERIASNDAGKGVPPWKVNLQYEKNWTVQSASDLAGSVTYSGIPYWDNNSITEMSDSLYFHNSVVYKDWLYVIGGLASGTGTPVVRRLNLKNPTGTWDDAGVTDLPCASLANFASVVYDHYLYVIGGLIEGVTSDKVIRLDLDNPTGAWDDAGVTDLPAQLYGHTATVYQNYVYVTGGLLGSGAGSITTQTLRLDLDNPSGAWDNSGVTSLPVARAYHSAVVHEHEHYLYITGGQVSGLVAVSRLDLDAPAGAWQTSGITDLPATRHMHSSVVCNNFLYLIGGIVASDYSASAIRLDLSNLSGAWDDDGVADLPTIRVGSSAVVYKNNIFVTGGWTGEGSGEPNTYVFRILVEHQFQLWLSKEYRTVTDSDPAVQTAHLLAPEMSKDTLLVDVDDAQAECTRLLNIYKVRPDMFQVEVHSSVLAYIQPGKIVKLISKRYGLAAGKLFVVIGIQVDWNLKKTTLIVWGGQDPVVVAASPSTSVSASPSVTPSSSPSDSPSTSPSNSPSSSPSANATNSPSDSASASPSASPSPSASVSASPSHSVSASPSHSPSSSPSHSASVSPSSSPSHSASASPSASPSPSSSPSSSPSTSPSGPPLIQTTLGAGYSVDVMDDGSEYYHDGSDWVGRGNTGALRTATLWDTLSIDPAWNITTVEVRFYIEGKAGTPGNISIDRYGSSHGEDDPRTDSGAVAYSNCAGNQYATFPEPASGAWTGWVDLGSTAVSDLAWCRNNGQSIWSVGLKASSTVEAGSTEKHINISEDNATTKSELRITYSLPSDAGLYVSWSPPTEYSDGTSLPLENIGGYKLNYGTSSGVYTTTIDVGNVLDYLVYGLELDVPYYFAVLAYDLDGYESAYSDEFTLTRTA